MLTRLYELLERRNAAIDTTVSRALGRLIEAQAERVELKVFRIASQIIMSESVPEPVRPTYKKITLGYACRTIGCPEVKHYDITFDAFDFTHARQQLASYLDGLNQASKNRYSYWSE